MTRKELEAIIVFMNLFMDNNFPVQEINAKYGLNLTETTSKEDALEAYLDKLKIKSGLETIKHLAAVNSELKKKNKQLLGIVEIMVDEFENSSKSSSDILMDALNKTKELLANINP